MEQKILETLLKQGLSADVYNKITGHGKITITKRINGGQEGQMEVTFAGRGYPKGYTKNYVVFWIDDNNEVIHACLKWST